MFDRDTYRNKKQNIKVYQAKGKLCGGTIDSPKKRSLQSPNIRILGRKKNNKPLVNEVAKVFQTSS